MQGSQCRYSPDMGTRTAPLGVTLITRILFRWPADGGGDPVSFVGQTVAVVVGVTGMNIYGILFGFYSIDTRIKIYCVPHSGQHPRIDSGRNGVSLLITCGPTFQFPSRPSSVGYSLWEIASILVPPSPMGKSRRLSRLCKKLPRPSDAGHNFVLAINSETYWSPLYRVFVDKVCDGVSSVPALPVRMSVTKE